MTNFQQIRATAPENIRGLPLFTTQSTRLIWLFLALFEGAMALRISLRLIGASPANPVAALVYVVTGAFLIPFNGFARTPMAAGMVFEASTLLAMVVYAFLAWMLARVAWIIFYRPYAAVPVTDLTITNRPL